ncbi:hypothetical protein ACLB2K_023134 [Fragaria x ananassa]
MESLFTCGPVLEHLIIDGYLGDEQYLPFNISAPELKRLEMTSSYDHRPSNHEELIPNFKFNINAPKLEKFELEESCLARYADPATASHFNLPTLNDLKHLELFLEDCWSRQLLFRLLAISPNLENLVLEIDIPWSADQEGNGWSSQKLVPRCLVSSLKTLSIRGLKSDDMEMVMFLLKNSKVYLSAADIYITCKAGNRDVFGFQNLSGRISRAQYHRVAYAWRPCP